MSPALIAALTVALGLDIFALSATAGRLAAPDGPCLWARVHAGLFYFLMPFAGWFCGREFRIADPHYVYCLALGLLFLLSASVLGDARRTSNPSPETPGPGRTALGLAGAVDALCLGVVGGTLWPAAPMARVPWVLALATLVAAPLGFSVGLRSRPRLERAAARISGGVLVLAGLTLLADYTLRYLLPLLLRPVPPP